MQVKRKAGRKASSVTIIGSRLVELLQERGMRQQDLADEITVGAFKGVSLSTINRAINNNRMDISVLHAVADYLNVSVDYLTGQSDVDHGLIIPVNLSMSIAHNVIGELIRCKDCRYYGNAQIGNKVALTNFCSLLKDCRRVEDYCSKAERKKA